MMVWLCHFYSSSEISLILYTEDTAQMVVLTAVHVRHEGE